MKRHVTLRVTIRPNAEAIEMDGQIFRDPADLWTALHRACSAEARAKPEVAESVFLDGTTLSAAFAAAAKHGGRPNRKALRHEVIARHSGGVEVRRILSTDSHILQNKTDKTTEELGL